MRARSRRSWKARAYRQYACRLSLVDLARELNLDPFRALFGDQAGRLKQAARERTGGEVVRWAPVPDELLQDSAVRHRWSAEEIATWASLHRVLGMTYREIVAKAELELGAQQEWSEQRLAELGRRIDRIDGSLLRAPTTEVERLLDRKALLESERRFESGRRFRFPTEAIVQSLVYDYRHVWRLAEGARQDHF